MSQGQNLAYTRISTADQDDARQVAGIEAAGVKIDRWFRETASGKNMTLRPQLAALVEYAREGDTVIVLSIDRLARSLLDLEDLINRLTKKGVKVHFIQGGLVFDGCNDNPAAVMLRQMLGAVAQFERALTRERQREGIALAKARGVYTGRKPVVDVGKLEKIREHLARDPNKRRAAREFGISRATLYRYLEVNA